jgi:hypothetical protein
MTAYIGSALSAVWTYASGTVTLNTDFTKFTYTPTIDLIDTSAGADTSKQFIAGFKDAKCNITVYHQSADLAIGTAVVEGTQGTLVVGPEGTAVGKMKWTIPALCMGAARNVSFNSAAEWSIDFQQVSGRTDGTF